MGVDPGLVVPVVVGVVVLVGALYVYWRLRRVERAIVDLGKWMLYRESGGYVAQDDYPGTRVPSSEGDL